MDFTSISKLTKEKLMKILSRIVLATMLLGVVTLAQADDDKEKMDVTIMNTNIIIGIKMNLFQKLNI